MLRHAKYEIMQGLKIHPFAPVSIVTASDVIGVEEHVLQLHSPKVVSIAHTIIQAH